MPAHSPQSHGPQQKAEGKPHEKRKRTAGTAGWESGSLGVGIGSRRVVESQWAWAATLQLIPTDSSRIDLHRVG